MRNTMIILFILIFLVGCTSTTGNVVKDTTKQNLQQANLNKLNVKISGMTCVGCASGVQSILQSLDGVVEAKVSYSEGIGEIIYNPNIIAKEQIMSSDAFSFYPAEIINDGELEEQEN